MTAYREVDTIVEGQYDARPFDGHQSISPQQPEPDARAGDATAVTVDQPTSKPKKGVGKSRMSSKQTIPMPAAAAISCAHHDSGETGYCTFSAPVGHEERLYVHDDVLRLYQHAVEQSADAKHLYEAYESAQIRANTAQAKIAVMRDWLQRIASDEAGPSALARQALQELALMDTPSTLDPESQPELDLLGAA